MFLRQIKLRGFKSFCDPVDIRFERGVSIVVGPNGSGKSNVSDAIVWASGSLSPHQLRAEKPDDVLFNGGAARKAVDHCEVELHFDNSSGEGPLPYSEIVITRRLHRGGEGQYLLNRSPVRRLDVLELLADVGLGGEMHAIISQGRVDKVLGSKPHERRALIEEAAGLGAFKQRRHRAELKLARVRIDVDRARDLELEVRKRLRPLAQQATAAERAEKLGEEIERLRIRLRQGELAHIDAQLVEVDERRQAATQEQRRADGVLEGLLHERRNAEEQLAQAAGRHEQATAALYRLRSAVERLDVRREHGEEAAKQLRVDAVRLRQLAELPRDTKPIEELEQAEDEYREASRAARAALERRTALEEEARLAAERLRALERSIAEREGLPPAARTLADAGERLALAALHVDAGYERAVAAALAWRGSAVIADSPRRAIELLERARNEGLGPLAVLLAGRTDAPGAASCGVEDAVRLGDHVRPLEGGELVHALVAGVWVVSRDRLAHVTDGLAVTVEGHGYDVAHGELWFEGETAKSVLLGLEARRRALAEEVGELGVQAEQAAAEAAVVFERERVLRERVNRAKLVVSKLPKPVDPAEVELLEALADAAERAHAGVVAAVERARLFESPLQARVDAGSQITKDLGENLRRLGEREAELRRVAQAARERVHQVSIENARLDTQRREVRAKLPEDVAGDPLGQDEEQELRTRLERLVRRREELGQVNPLAKQQYEEESARLVELTAQREDLERSLDELEKLRQELTEEVERRFEQTFASVQEHFAEVASTLFPGGEGRLTLTSEAEEGEEPGVEVELRPAGKRITRLSLLSGGEKALGALSFLFALFLARPCPFYLLDEVEAALDDTNVGRFVELLRRYADRAQFIVVTHQKRTMEAADILYGVTMGSDGVSQIVSRRLRDAAVAAGA
ncbi:MAG: AAA family ATPase [Thermoleophilia bacterium]